MNATLISIVCMLADATPIGKFEHLGMRFRGELTDFTSGRVLGLMAIPLAIFVLFVGLSWVASRFQLRPEKRSPRRLFRELADAHDMGARERTACHEVASAAGLTLPAEVFLRPDLYEMIAARDADLAARLYRANV